MDEILDFFSNLVEGSQIYAAMVIQQSQQWISNGMLQSQHFFREITNELNSHQIKDLSHKFIIWLQKEIQELYHFITTFHLKLNSEYFYHQIYKIHNLDISKREIAYFCTGLLTGSLIGYTIALNWNLPIHKHLMKAIVCHHHFGPEGVSVIDDAIMPTIQKSNELLIQVKAASLHDIDVKVCYGYSKVYRRLLNAANCRDLPVILGRSCAGIIVDIGHSVVDFDIGDKVFMAVPSWSSGTMAEYIVVPETLVAKMPKILPFEASASLPYSGCIAWEALKEVTTIKEGNAKGKRILVCGGHTSVGCLLIQLLKLWGSYTITICSKQAVPILKALGADEVIILEESDVYKELELQDKFDAILYTGGNIDEKLLKKYLLYYGSYVSTAPEYLITDTLGPFTSSLFSSCTKFVLLFQFFFGINNYYWKDGSKLRTSYLQVLQELADADQLQPILDRVYAPDCIDQALAHIMDISAIGSTVIKFH